MKYWLLKTEPDCFSIRDLASARGKRTCWDGVRNFQARNWIRDEMRVGDRCLFYHSGCPEPAIVGLCEIVRAAYPDPTSWDPLHPHFDARSSPQSPRWFMVDVQHQRTFRQPLTLARLREINSLKKMELLRRGSRLSVQPVRPAEFQAVLDLSEESER